MPSDLSPADLSLSDLSPADLSPADLSPFCLLQSVFANRKMVPLTIVEGLVLPVNRAASFAITAVAASMLIACGDGGPSGTSTTTASKHAGDTQSATVGQPVAIAPSVRVVQGSTPVSGTSVTFTVASGGGSVAGGSVTTDANGVASVTSWTLGTTAGANTLTASVSGVSGSFTFSATGTPGPAANIIKSAGDAQVLKTRQAVTVRPAVRVTDQFGNNIGAVQVTFAIAAGGGTITGPTQSTGTDGVATVGSWTMGTSATQNRLTATIPGTATGNPATFTAEAQEVLIQPAQDTTLAAGTLQVTRLVIPVGRTVTVAGALTINSDSAVLIQGTLIGNCVSITINGEKTVEITGTVNNGCAVNTVGQPLTILGKGGYSLSGATIVSGGNVKVTNDLSVQSFAPLREMGMLAGLVGGIVAPGSCDYQNTTFIPQPLRARDGANANPDGVQGGSTFEYVLSCLGDLRFLGNVEVRGQDGGNGGNGNHSSSTAAGANSRGGNGGRGGITRLVATGRVIFSGLSNRILIGSGGNGGAGVGLGVFNPALPVGPAARGEGGVGGSQGAFDIRGMQGVTVNDPIEIRVGTAGNGGLGDAQAANGRNATDLVPAGIGGAATSVGGAGGSTPQEAFVPPVAPVIGAEKVVLTQGNAGVGGNAVANAGDGGNGSEPFPDGAAGGEIRSTGGLGGTSAVKDLQNVTHGSGANGGDATFRGGGGGDGFDHCAPKLCPGGDGGVGGRAEGNPGAGGFGAAGMSGIPGTRFYTTVGIGGDAGNGFMAGDRGPAGANVTGGAAPAGNFVQGLGGTNCFPVTLLPMTILSIVDPAGHHPFIKFCSVATVQIFGSGTTMGLSFAASTPAPAMSAFSVSGAVGPLPRTFTGSATFSGSIPVKVTVVSINTDGTVTITVEFGGPGSPAGHPLNTPITYTKRATLPAACPLGTPPPAGMLDRISSTISMVTKSLWSLLANPVVERKVVALKSQ